jgi:MFS family permease
LQLNWIVSAFNLTSAAFIPFWGQVADIFGRQTSLQATQVLMLIGSALCTGAPTSAFGLFLLGRVLQGIGTLVRVVLSDKVSLEENARNWSAFTLVGGLSYGIGPVVGGYLTKAHWRWCFTLNLPIALAGLVVIFRIRGEMRGPQPLPELGESGEPGRRVTTIDVGG